MMVHTADFYHSAIRLARPNSWNIRAPENCGGVSPIFLADGPNGTIVCKFNDANAVLHNHDVGNLLNLYDIPVPKSTIHTYFDSWFEIYPYCPDATLGERIRGGATREQIWSVYQQAINIQKQISDIPTYDFRPRYGLQASDMFILNQKMRVTPILAHTYGMVHKLFSGRGEMRLLHNDIQPENILVGDDNRISRLIDMDTIALGNESFSVLLMLRTYPLDNHMELMDYYEDTTHRKINRRAISTGLNILNAIRKPQLKLNELLWRGYQPHQNWR